MRAGAARGGMRHQSGMKTRTRSSGNLDTGPVTAADARSVFSIANLSLGPTNGRGCVMMMMARDWYYTTGKHDTRRVTMRKFN